MQDSVDMQNVLPQEEPSADNKMVDKHECEEEPEVQHSTNTLNEQEELPADNKMMNEYEYSHIRIVMTCLTETLDVAKMLAYIDENYNNTSQMEDGDETIADLEREKPNVRENPYSIDETYQEEDVADNEQTNGVANKKESRGSP
jgi:hypothetical protein